MKTEDLSAMAITQAGVELEFANVIVVEDERLMQALIGRYIEAIGRNHPDLNIRFTLNEDGWDLLTADLSRVQVAVIDILLPKVTGVDLIKHFRKNFPNMGIVPISGMATEPFRRELKELLPPGFSLLDKPVRPDVFQEAFLKAYRYRGQIPEQKPYFLNQEGIEEPLWRAISTNTTEIGVSTIKRKLLKRKANIT